MFFLSASPHRQAGRESRVLERCGSGHDGAGLQEDVRGRFLGGSEFAL